MKYVVYATAPFIKPQLITKGFELMNDNKKEFCFAALLLLCPSNVLLGLKKMVMFQCFFGKFQ